MGKCQTVRAPGKAEAAFLNLVRPDPSLIARPLPMPVDLWASGLVVPRRQTWTAVYVAVLPSSG